MRLGLYFILAAIPFLELALLIKVGQSIGVLLTLLIVVGTALAGAYALSSQSFQVMQRALASVQQGKPPVAPVLEGAFVILAGLLLIMPGLMSDFVGLLLLVPQIRHRVAVFSLRQLLKSPNFRMFVFGETTYSGTAEKRWPGSGSPGQRAEPRSQQQGEGPIIEGEFERLDERTVDPYKTRGGQQRRSP